MNFKNWKSSFVGLVLGGLSLYPSTSQGSNDLIEFKNVVSNSNEVISDTYKISHNEYATEDINFADIVHSGVGPRASSWDIYLYSTINNTNLALDSRPTNSVSTFNFDSGAYIGNAQNIFGNQKVSIEVKDTSFYPGLNSKRHYVGKFETFNEFTEDNSGFVTNFNVRDVVTNFNQIFFLPGAANYFVDASLVDSNGFVKTGEGFLSVDWNSLNSVASIGGSNDFSGQKILPYNANTNVQVYADSGKSIDKIITEETDNLGNLSVITNDFSGIETNYYVVNFNNLKGWNKVTSSFKENEAPAAHTVTITNADKYGLSPTEFVNLDAGSSITSSVADATNFYYYVSPTERDKVTGLEDVLSVDTGTSTQVGADFVYSPINSSLDLKPTEEKEFKFEAYSFDTSRGTVSGDTNSWVVSNGLINVSANANPFFHLHSWSNVPSGMETNENLSYNLGAANTNVYATFAPDTTSNGVPHERIYNDTGITNFVPGIESQDPDNDGLSILEEWLADTNMGDSNSVLPNLYISQDGLGNRYVEIGPETSWERVYELKSKKDLTDINQAQLVYTSPGVGSNLQFDVSSDTNSVNFYSYEVGLPQPE